MILPQSKPFKPLKKSRNHCGKRHGNYGKVTASC
jgi:hypothetical protein